MRYHCLHIKTSFAEEWQKDVFDQTLCEAGVDSIDGELYYIPSDMWEAQKTTLTSQIADVEGAELLSAEACPDENWNAAWEAEHQSVELPMGVRIIPHCAFGAGHHETTSMMIEELIRFKSQISNFKFNVLDHGTGTGVLAIFAKRLGAEQVVAIDIDEKSVENAKENAALNKVDIDVRLGSTPPENEQFELILANIHRNILLNNMHAYASALQPEGQLWLSGFYEDDCEALQAAAEQEGLQLIATKSNGEWYLLQFVRHSFCREKLNIIENHEEVCNFLCISSRDDCVHRTE